MYRRIMLQEGGRKRARVPLTQREGLAGSMLTVSRSVSSGLASSNDASAIGHSEVGLPSLASRISPAIVHASSLTTTEDGVYLAVSSSEGPRHSSQRQSTGGIGMSKYLTCKGTVKISTPQTPLTIIITHTNTPPTPCKKKVIPHTVTNMLPP